MPDEVFAFDRTVSRLAEMQGQAYLKRRVLWSTRVGAQQASAREVHSEHVTTEFFCVELVRAKAVGLERGTVQLSQSASKAVGCFCWGRTAWACVYVASRFETAGRVFRTEVWGLPLTASRARAWYAIDRLPGRLEEEKGGATELARCLSRATHSIRAGVHHSFFCVWPFVQAVPCSVPSSHGRVSLPPSPCSTSVHIRRVVLRRIQPPPHS